MNYQWCSSKSWLYWSHRWFVFFSIKTYSVFLLSCFKTFVAASPPLSQDWLSAACQSWQRASDTPIHQTALREQRIGTQRQLLRCCMCLQSTAQPDLKALQRRKVDHAYVRRAWRLSPSKSTAGLIEVNVLRKRQPRSQGEPFVIRLVLFVLWNTNKQTCGLISACQLQAPPPPSLTINSSLTDSCILSTLWEMQ